MWALLNSSALELDLDVSTNPGARAVTKVTAWLSRNLPFALRRRWGPTPFRGASWVLLLVIDMAKLSNLV